MKDLLDNDTISLAGSFQLSTPRYGFVMPNSYHYVPQANFTGIDSLAYTVCVGDNCKSSYVLITVKDSVPYAPCTAKAYPDWVTTVKDSVVRYPVYLNDEVCDRFQILMTSIPAFGRASVDEQMRIVYQPPPGFIGSDSVWYNLQQRNSNSTGSWLHVRINPKANDPLPAYCTTQYARADTLIAQISPDSTRQYVIPVLDNDLICNNLCSNLRVEVISQEGPGEASVTLNGQAIQYKVSNAAANSVTRLRYRVCATCSTQPVCLESQVYIRNEH